VTVFVAAPPIWISTTFDGVSPSPAVALPEVARILATPEVFAAMKVVTATPPRVSDSVGLTCPFVAVKRTSVPSWTAVPLCSTTNAVISAMPPGARMPADAVTLIVDSVGAPSGTLSQAIEPIAAAAVNRTRNRTG